MASKNQTDKSRYPSMYSPGGFVTAAQYIIERVCEKKAQNEGKDLPVKFWNNPEWAKYYKGQLRKCHSLLKKYDATAIVKALRDRRTYTVYSLFAPWLIPVIEEYQKELDAEVRVAPEVDRKEEKKTRTKPKKTKLSALRELNG